MSNELFILTCFAAWLGLAVVIKASALVVLRWGSPGRALVAAIVMNLASSLLSPLSAAADQVSPWAFWAVALAQVAVEFVALYLLNRSKLRTALVAAGLSNLVAFGLLAAFLWATSGG